MKNLESVKSYLDELTDKGWTKDGNTFTRGEYTVSIGNYSTHIAGESGISVLINVGGEQKLLTTELSEIIAAKDYSVFE